MHDPEQAGPGFVGRNKLYIIGGIVMLLAAGVVAFALSGGADRFMQIADKHAKAEGAKPDALKHMELDAQFAGPLKDTLVQRWRDPKTGTLCYIYLPVMVRHSPPTKMGLVQYGANGIGTISCVSGT